MDIFTTENNPFKNQMVRNISFNGNNPFKKIKVRTFLQGSNRADKNIFPYYKDFNQNIFSILTENMY